MRAHAFVRLHACSPAPYHSPPIWHGPPSTLSWNTHTWHIAHTHTHTHTHGTLHTPHPLRTHDVQRTARPPLHTRCTLPTHLALHAAHPSACTTHPHPPRVCACMCAAAVHGFRGAPQLHAGSGLPAAPGCRPRPRDHSSMHGSCASTGRAAAAAAAAAAATAAIACLLPHALRARKVGVDLTGLNAHSWDGEA